PPRSAVRPSSCRPRPVFSSTRSTRARSRKRCVLGPSYRARTPPPAPQPRSTTSMSRPAGWRRSSSEPCKLRQPTPDQRPDRLFTPRLACDLERLLVTLARLCRVDALLEPVVPGDDQLLDPLPGVIRGHR